ncbi:Gfo/Idh/MocA family oxidoreductase [Candidatus Poribacteria bacterium]|nr:Gfo/Idh/MocA family oxidoreductase [Candidatus Poribacteria bacterium]
MGKVMKIAFIGAGGIAGNYRGSLKRLQRPITAICDINAERAAQVAGAENATAYIHHGEMLEKEKPEVVFICIPPGAHTTQVADAARTGAAVFVAKPIALDIDTANRTLDAIDKAGVLNQVGYMARYSDITAKAKEIIGEKELSMGFGRFLCRMGAGHPWWGKFAISGGQMLEQSTHVFDLLRYFLGDVTEVQAFGIKDVSKSIADFEECTVCNLHFANGAVGNVTSTCVAGAPEGFAAELVGDNLYLKLILDLKLRGSVEGKQIDYDGVESGYFRQVEQFMQAVETNNQSLIRSSYADAVKTLAVTLAANCSLETGKVEKV